METRIRKLYDRFLEGKATNEEINEIYDRITATPEELKEFREYEKFWEQIHKPSEEVLASLADVKATIKSYKRRRAWRFVSAVSAAAVVIAVVMFRIHAGESDPAIPAAAVQEYVVNVPAGGRTDIALPDGTKVMLNAGSRLSYTSEFNERTRDIFLSGEGYFEVAHDKVRPFNVNTSNALSRSWEQSSTSPPTSRMVRRSRRWWKVQFCSRPERKRLSCHRENWSRSGTRDSQRKQWMSETTVDGPPG